MYLWRYNTSILVIYYTTNNDYVVAVKTTLTICLIVEIKNKNYMFYVIYDRTGKPVIVLSLLIIILSIVDYVKRPILYKYSIQLLRTLAFSDWHGYNIQMKLHINFLYKITQTRGFECLDTVYLIRKQNAEYEKCRVMYKPMRKEVCLQE